jgi:hypothetical protein
MKAGISLGLCMTIMCVGLALIFVSIHICVKAPLDQDFRKMMDSITMPNPQSALHVLPSDSLLNRMYELKKDLLFSELQLRGESASNAESIINQGRLAIVTLILAFLAFNIEKGKQKELFISSTWILLFSFLFIFCMYIYDSFMMDLQLRALERCQKICNSLNRLPTMSFEELSSLTVFPTLKMDFPEGIIRKIGFLFCPNYSQVISYVPVFLLLIYMFCKTVIKPKSENSD